MGRRRLRAGPGRLLLTAGALADRFGRRRIFVIGLVWFTTASVLCGLSTTPTMLNLARGLQGIGGAAMFATSLALIAAGVPAAPTAGRRSASGARRSARAVAIGPLVGGVLTEQISWQAIFFVNVPIGIAAVAVSLMKVDESARPGRSGWTRRALVTFSGGLFLLIFALVRGNAEGWGSPMIVGFLVGAVVLLVAFVRRGAARRGARDVRPSLFRKPAFGGASIAAFGLSARRCSRCSSTSRSTSRTRSATRRSRPACASCR